MITLGSNSNLSLTIPSPGESNWAAAIRTGCFQKIVDHNHQGLAGTGSKLLGYLALDLTTSLVTNNTWLLARNAANSANVKLLKLGSNNVDISIGESTISPTSSRVGYLVLKSNTYVSAVDTAETGLTNIFKTESDKVVLGNSNVSELQGSVLNISGLNKVAYSGTAITLVDNQSSAIDTGITTALLGSETLEISYTLVRNSAVQYGTLHIDSYSGSITNEYTGTYAGVNFSFASGIIKYTSTNTGFAPYLNFVKQGRY